MFINEHVVTELSCSFLLFLLPTYSFPLTERPLVGKTFPFFHKSRSTNGFYNSHFTFLEPMEAQEVATCTYFLRIRFRYTLPGAGGLFA